MRITPGNRLAGMFTLWVVAAAVIPSLAIAGVGWYIFRFETTRLVQHELEIVARMKEDRVVTWLSETRFVLSDAADRIFSGDSEAEALEAAYRDLQESARGVWLVRGGSVVSAAPEDRLRDTVVIPDNDIVATPDALWISDGVPGTDAIVVAAFPHISVSRLLHADVNDARFFSQETGSELSFGLGKTADAVLIGPDARLLSESLVTDQQPGDLVRSSLLQSWLASPDSYVLKTMPWAGRSIVYARKSPTAFGTIATVVSVSEQEALDRLYRDRELVLVLYLVLLAGVALILLALVGDIGGVVVAPIVSSIQRLRGSAQTIGKSVTLTADSVALQNTVITSLTNNMGAQLADTRSIEKAIRMMQEALSRINQSSSRTAKASASIQARAGTAIDEAKRAQAGVSGIERLAVSHATLADILASYSEQVERIARDVKGLSRAISFLSLNAGIEAGKSGVQPGSIAHLVAQVGDLSRMSNDASDRINTLVDAIQKELVTTKADAERERREAQASTAVIARALQNVIGIIRDTATITTSIASMHQGITDQAKTITTVADQADSVTREAKSSLRETTRLMRLSEDQKAMMAKHVAVVKKLTASIDALTALIGTMPTHDETH